MKIYSTKNSKLLQETLRVADYIDACTPSIPIDAVIADAALPMLEEHQAYQVSGTKKGDHFTVSNNVAVVADYRHVDVFSTETGEKITVTELGELPDNATLTPKPDEYHTFANGKWALTKAGRARKKADEAKAHNATVFAQIDKLEQKQLRPLREALVATGDAKKAATARVKAIDEQIATLRKGLK